MSKYRIKEYTNKYGTRVFQVQIKKWYGWVDFDTWFNTKHYSLLEAKNCIKWWIESKSENKAKRMEYHYCE